MITHRITFENNAGDKLSARLDLPLSGKPMAFALFAHCFTCSKNYKSVTNISRALCGRGIAVFRFDFTGLGESGGDFADTNFSSNVEDLVAAANFLGTHHQAPKILVGHSLGGAAILQAASRIPSAVAVATIAAPSDPRHLKKVLRDAADVIEKSGEAVVVLAGRSFRIKKQFLDDLERSRMQEHIGNLGKALLIFHSPSDNIVGIENAQEIFVAARHPKSFVSLDRADHLLGDENDSCYVGEVVAAWGRKYVDYPDGADRGEKGEVIVRTEQERYRTEIAAGVHQMTADEPLSVGGTDKGGSPYQYLLAGLGACTSITLRMYADRKEWPLHEIIVRLSHEKIHAADCEQCETQVGKIDVIEREIQVGGPLDNDQRARLLEIADKCPVHRTLHSEVVVRTRLRADSENAS
ncbi:MAG: alpha/beta fold hydrolase [Candidatus Latescibacterota bacterium]|nr:MAG: alpha/beta fold hydrolase [Candidatus Latescibacterota bacterium]